MLDLPIKYALFDMDGTLTETMGFWRNCINEFLKEEGVSLSEEQIRHLEKTPFEIALEEIRAMHLSPRADTVTFEDIYQILKHHYERDAVPRAGVVALLEDLKARGVKMGVATLSPYSLAMICLEKTGLLPYFSFIIGPEGYPEGKNGPRIFLDAAEKFGCEPREMHLFEDSLYSIETAVAMGIPVVGTSDKYQAHNRERIIDVSVAFFDEGFTKRIK